MTRKIFLPSLFALVLCTSCGDGEPTYDASGIFEITEVIVSAEGTGQIVTFNIQEGDNLTAGQAVGCIDTIQLSLRREQLLATQSATDSKHLNENKQLASLRQQIANLERERKRFEGLLAENAATQKQVDDINYQIEVLRRNLAATGEQLAGTNSSLDGQSRSLAAQISQTEDAIRKSVIVSPITGTVLASYAEQGEYATTGKPLFKVADVSRMKLRAYITADQLTGLKLGQAATVYADQGTDSRKAYKGKVVWISDKAEFTPKTIQTRDERANLVYAVKIEVANDGLIKDGMYGEVEF